MARRSQKGAAANSEQPNQNKLPTFRRTAISLAIAAALPGAALMMPAASLAQDADDNEADFIEEITVTGYRRSLMNSMALKQTSDSIVEAVSAEDIGKLPDFSIAESWRACRA